MQQSSDPATALPPDVLYDAFRYLKPPIGHGHNNSDIMQSRTPEILSLGHVSRTWRAVAFSFPLLWDSVDIVLPRRNTKVLAELLQEWMDRSRPCNLFISFSCSVSHHVRRSEPILRVLLNHSHRWYNVTFDLPIAFLHAFDDERYNFPALDSISLGPLSANDSRVVGERETVKFLDNAPNIRVIRVVGVGLTDHGKAFTQLTHLDAEDVTLKEMEVLLDRGPNLRELAVARNHVWFENSFSPPEVDKPPTSLSQLRALKVWSPSTFQLYLFLPDAPSLRYLTVNSRILPLYALLLFLKRNSFQHLHTLVLITSTPVQLKDLSDVLHMADSVVTFFFLSSKESDRKWLQRSLPDMLNPDQPHIPQESQLQPKVILPNLENLYYVTPNPIRTLKMINMIKRRWNGYDRGQGSTTSRRWTKLRSVHFRTWEGPGNGIVDNLEVEISEGLQVHYCVSGLGIGTGCDSILDYEAALL